MAETIALSKFACPACGGEATWNPAKAKLVCPFCGTESPAKEGAAGTVVEHDLVTALRGIGDDVRGWQADKRQVKCQSCNAISVLDPKRQAQNCEFCGSAQLVAYEETKAALRPESVLPFKVSESVARDRIRVWYGKLWLAPSALAKKALTDTVRGVYLPYWTFDAHVDAEWTAEAGHYYYTTETFEQNGRTQTRQVQHVRWEPASGRLQHAFDDDLVCASVGIHPGLLRGIEPFPTGELKPYDSAFVAGWVVERYQIDLIAAAQRARDAMDAQVRAMAAAEVPGDTYRNLAVRADYSAQTFKHILAPVWFLSYTYGARVFQCAMNGVTGAIRGEYPKSPWKVALLVLGILLVVAIALLLGGRW
ncbi:MAG: zinc ribbon domain-containing protein [Betaproteobacteria bacterium]